MREHEATWRELEALIALADRRGLHRLSGDERARLPQLYRATLASLSAARSASLDRALTEYLENLAGRAYLVVHGARPAPGRPLAAFFAWRLPAAVRRARWHLLVAFAVTLAGAATAFQLTSADPAYHATFVGEAAQGLTPASSTAELRAGLYRDGGGGALLTELAAELFSHNARVGILAFALGLAAGVPTLLLLFYNGLALGSLAALYHSRGLGVELWAWLLPHGVTELLAVLLCGAAGLLLAHGLVLPGARPRIDSLRERGREASAIVAGAILMLLAAGLIEGVFRQLVTSVPARYGVASATAAWWICYLGLAGRRRAREAA